VPDNHNDPGPSAWADSDYEELAVPRDGNTIWRQLFKVYGGRFCFRLGAGVRCGGVNAVLITEGKTESLELSATIGGQLPVIPISLQAGVTRSVEVTHTFSQQLGPWSLGPCDSAFPVLCFDNARLRLYRWKKAYPPLRVARPHPAV
jgi:hypothetical protein